MKCSRIALCLAVFFLALSVELSDAQTALPAQFNILGQVTGVTTDTGADPGDEFMVGDLIHVTVFFDPDAIDEIPADPDHSEFLPEYFYLALSHSRLNEGTLDTTFYRSLEFGNSPQSGRIEILDNQATAVEESPTH